MQKWNEEVGALADRLLTDTRETVEFDDMLAGLDVKDAGLRDGSAEGEGY